MLENIIFLFVGLISGLVIFWLINRQKLRNEKSTLSMLIDDLKSNISNNNDQLSAKEGEIRILTAGVAERDANIASMGEKLEDQKGEVIEIQDRMRKEFRLMANEIMTSNSEKFTRENREKLDEILKPFSENLKDFKKKVEDSYVNEAKERFSLKEEVKRLAEMNEKISNEANALTRALKGDSKTQGNWGEMILESILEKTGLVRDREFFVQESHTDKGKRFQPDIIVNYPGDRSIIIDSKVSLTAYERYVEADDNNREAELKAHLISIKNHINELASKNYQDLYSINTLDFVMMFLPVEPAYLLAIHTDNQLWNYAYDKRILMISPTNLIAALKMIQNMWLQERQSRNVLEIAAQGGALYDDFVLLAERLLKLGKKLDEAQLSYTDTMKKLKDGKGNLIRRVEKLQKLGARVKKSMPENFRDDELAE